MQIELWEYWLTIAVRYLNPPVISAIVIFLVVGYRAHNNSRWWYLYTGWIINVGYIFLETFNIEYRNSRSGVDPGEKLDPFISKTFDQQAIEVSCDSLSALTSTFFLCYALGILASPEKRYLPWIAWPIGAAVILWLIITHFFVFGTFERASIGYRIVRVAPEVIFSFSSIGLSSIALNRYLATREITSRRWVTVPWGIYALIQPLYFTFLLSAKLVHILTFVLALAIKAAISVGLFLVFNEQVRIAHVQRMGYWQKLAFSWFSHELKNPIYSIRNVAHAIKTRLMQREYRRAQNETARLINMTKTLTSVIDAVKIAAEPLEPQKLHYHSLNEIIDKALEITKATSSIPSGHLTLAYAKNLDVCAIKEHLIQAFANVIRNALEAADSAAETETSGVYTSEKRFIIKTEAKEEAGRDFVLTSIVDFGPGIPKADQENIFKPYYSTKQGINRGLGLVVFRNFIEMFGGTVRVISPLTNLKTGTMFEVSLPRVKDKTEDPVRFWERATRNREGDRAWPLLKLAQD